MPANNHLSFFEVKDFTPGLWDERGASHLLAPNNAMTVLTDYMPLKAGGLRAMYNATDVGTSGVATIANKATTGLFARNGVAARSGASTDNFDALMSTIDIVDFKMRVYRMDGSNSETTWKLVGTGTFDTPAASSSAHQVTSWEYFKDVSGNEFYLLTTHSGGNQGLYKIAYVPGAGPPGGDGVVTKIATYTGALAISQARMMVNAGNDEKIIYGDVGLTTITSPSTQVLAVAPNRKEPNIVVISAVEPSDLLIGKEGAPWVIISGDISSTSTPVYEVGEAHYPRTKQQTARVPNGGIAFFENEGRIFVTDGRSFQSISDAIPRFSGHWADTGLVGMGSLAVLNNLLFAPGGFVYDFDTSAWFTSSDFANSFYHVADPVGGLVWMSTEGVSFSVKKMSVLEGASNLTKRKSSGTFRTIPFSDPTGRAIELREVQLFLQCYSTSTAVVKAIDGTGSVVSTQTLTGLTGRGKISALFPNVQDDYISVDVTLSADDGVHEAPTVERVRYGFGAGNLVK